MQREENMRRDKRLVVRFASKQEIFILGLILLGFLNMLIVMWSCRGRHVDNAVGINIAGEVTSI